MLLCTSGSRHLHISIAHDVYFERWLASSPLVQGCTFMRSHALLITFTETSNNAIQLYSRSKNREAHGIYILSQNTHNVLRDILTPL